MKQSAILTIIFIFSMLNTYASVSDGPYLGLEIGEANQSIIYNSSNFNLNTDGSNLTTNNWNLIGRLNLGYNFSKYSGIELGYNYNTLSGYNYPNTSGSFTGNLSTLDISYILYIPTTIQKLSVFGRVGVAYDWLNGDSSYNSISSPAGSSFADILGAGLKYNISPKMSFRIEWLSNGLLFPININSGSTNIAAFNEQVFLIGLNFHF